LMSYWHF